MPAGERGGRGRPGRSWLAILAGTALAAAISGCASFATSAAANFAGNVSTAILDQDDPQLVRDGAPAYLLALDGLVSGSPHDPAILGAAASLYAAYAMAFVAEEERAARLAARARDYGRRAVCAADRRACTLDGLGYQDFIDTVSRLQSRRASDALFSYTTGWLAWLRTHSDDWTGLSDLPRIERALEHLLRAGRGDIQASVSMYLGILNSLRPPALGGDPEVGRAYFERALRLSDRRDLSVHVEYARGYARLVYDRELHDQLLAEVIAAPAQAPGLTLFNTLAKQQAEQLLAGSESYF